MSRMFAYQAIKAFEETKGTEDCSRSGLQYYHEAK